MTTYGAIVLSGLTILSILVVSVVLLQFISILIRIHYFWKDHKKLHFQDFPIITVLVAARNEQENLPVLLKSLSELDYPKEKLQLLFADDQSSDNTYKLLMRFCEGQERRELLSIQAQQAQHYSKNGKANALAFLSEKALGDYYFFTDADCEVGPQWIKEGVSCFRDDIGIVLGTTQVRANKLFQRFQELDWWNTLGYVKVASDLGVPTTGLGNNMIIKKEAYWKSGGFQNIPFNLTEDLEISKSIRKIGYRLAHQVSPGMLVRTKPETSLVDLIHQRKRWMNGVMTLPWYWLFMLSIQFAYFLCVLFLTYISPSLGISIAGSKILLQAFFLKKVAARAGQGLDWKTLFLFDFYYFYTTTLSILYYFWPSQVKWKSRTYS